MTSIGRLLVITVPWRKVRATVPALVLIGGGIAFSAPATPGRDITNIAASSDSPAIVVPDTALTLPAPAELSTDNPPVAIPAAPAPVLLNGAVRSSSLVTVDSAGIPVRALEGYRRAATLIHSADPACNIDWALPAAIGRVESDHGRVGGNYLDSAGVAQPGIIGIPLDGSNATARITDTDGGLLDRDSIYDRAVGPMQFIPSTWRVVSVDADGDGVKNPQDIVDAATAAAIYLCSGPGDLNRPGDLYAAILRYNASDSYVQMVTALADTYRLGVSALPDSDPGLATAGSDTASGQPAPTLSTVLGQKAAAALGAPTPNTTTPGTTTPDPTTPITTPADPTTPITTTPTPTATPTATATTPTPPPDPSPTPTATTPAPTPTPDPTLIPDPAPTTTATISTPTPTPTPTPNPTLIPDPAPTVTATPTTPTPAA